MNEFRGMWNILFMIIILEGFFAVPIEKPVELNAILLTSHKMYVANNRFYHVSHFPFIYNITGPTRLLTVLLFFELIGLQVKLNQGLFERSSFCQIHDTIDYAHPNLNGSSAFF